MATPINITGYSLDIISSRKLSLSHVTGFVAYIYAWHPVLITLGSCLLQQALGICPVYCSTVILSTEPRIQLFSKYLLNCIFM